MSAWICSVHSNVRKKWNMNAGEPKEQEKRNRRWAEGKKYGEGGRRSREGSRNEMIVRKKGRAGRRDKKYTQ